MFLLNSRLASFVVSTFSFHERTRTSPKGYVQLSLPSSLRIVLPIAFVYSTRPPVSVYGTAKLFSFTSLFLKTEKYLLASSQLAFLGGLKLSPTRLVKVVFPAFTSSLLKLAIGEQDFSHSVHP